MNNINENLHCVVSTSYHMQLTHTLVNFKNTVYTLKHYLSIYKYTIYEKIKHKHLKNFVITITQK